MKTLNKTVLNEILQNRIDADLKANCVSGAAVMVAQNGEILSQIYAGVKDPRTGEPLQPHTIYRLASMTKPVTGIAALVGMQKGWYSIFDKVSDHLPEFANVSVGRLEDGKVVPDHKPISDLRIYQLLCHINGILTAEPIDLVQGGNIPVESWQTCRTMVDHFTKNCCFSFDPMERCSYSGRAAFDVMACIIEKKSGLPYAEFVKQNILDPLGLKDLIFTATEEQWDRMITMTDRSWEGLNSVATDMGRHMYEGLPLTYHSGGASMAGSVEDYFVFAEMLRGKGSYNGVQIVRPELMELYSTPFVPACTPGRDIYDSWGLGVRVTQKNPHLPAGTFGWSGAYGTHFWVDPENQITAVYMRNSRWHDSHGCGTIGQQFEKDVMRALAES